MRPEWIGLVSKTITDGLVFTAVILQALGAEVKRGTDIYLLGVYIPLSEVYIVLRKH